MKKSIILGILTVFAGTALFAGDVATFVDKGFTADGKYYVFGQYGKVDKKFQGYAEIYQVDVEKNDYVDGGVFKTAPSAATADKTGKEVFESLEGKSYYYFKNLKTTTADIDHVYYILDDVNKKGTDLIEFKDYRNSNIENPDYFHIQLVPTIVGTGKNVKSSFYIDVEKRDSEGNVLSKVKVGTPSLMRKGVSNYKIERIFSDNEGRNLIFVVEKLMEDETGISVRYMIEATKF